MNVLLCFDSKFVMPAMTTIYSLFKNNKDVCLYIFHSGLREQEKMCILQLASIDKNNKIILKEINKEDLLDCAYIYGRYSVSIYYRFLAYRLLDQSIERVLYLDTDIIVKGDISTLYNTDFEGNYFVGCLDSTSDPEQRLGLKEYINSGVLLMNLRELRSENRMEPYWEKVSEPGYSLALPDQDALNIIFNKKIKYVDDIKWNCFPFFGKLTKEQEDYIKKNSKIVHFVSKRKPWLQEYTDYWYACGQNDSITKYLYDLYMTYLDETVNYIEQNNAN